MVGMAKADLASSVELALMSSAKAFEGKLGELIDAAVEDYSRYKPRILAHKIMLSSDELTYPAPSDFKGFSFVFWGRKQLHTMKPWEPGFPVRLPRMTLIDSGEGRQLMFDYPPTSDQLNCYGREYTFTYTASHLVGDTDDVTTIQPSDRQLIILRATAEAMRRLSMRGATKPVAVNDSVGGQPKNGTPGALYELFMNNFHEALSRV